MTKVKISNESRVLPLPHQKPVIGEYYLINNPYKHDDSILVLVTDDDSIVNVETGELFQLSDDDYAIQLNPSNLREQVTITI